MNLDMIHEAPLPLSLKRNGLGSEFKERDLVADQDAEGQYFGASLRRGPFMSVQEDRVSKLFKFIHSFL